MGRPHTSRRRSTADGLMHVAEPRHAHWIAFAFLSVLSLGKYRPALGPHKGWREESRRP